MHDEHTLLSQYGQILSPNLEPQIVQLANLFK